MVTKKSATFGGTPLQNLLIVIVTVLVTVLVGVIFLFYQEISYFLYCIGSECPETELAVSIEEPEAAMEVEQGASREEKYEILNALSANNTSETEGRSVDERINILDALASSSDLEANVFSTESKEAMLDRLGN